eukprot:gene3706-7370_t
MFSDFHYSQQPSRFHQGKRNCDVLQMSSIIIDSTDKKIPILQQNWKVLPDIWDSLANAMPNRTMLTDPIHGDNVQLTFSEANSLITKGATALQSMGLVPGDCVSLFSENSHRWFLIEQAIMKAGCCNAVRGAFAPIEELKFIYDNSKSIGVVVENEELLQQLYANGGLKSDSGTAKFAIVLYPPNANANANANGQSQCQSLSGDDIAARIGTPGTLRVITYDELMRGHVTTRSSPSSPSPVPVPLPVFKQVLRDPESTATLVYTSGTTSRPKGVILRHRNLMHQVKYNSFNRLNGGSEDPFIGDVFVSILPCWHIFERTTEYFFLARGSQMVYSNLRNFKSDLVVCVCVC